MTIAHVVGPRSDAFQLPLPPCTSAVRLITVIRVQGGHPQARPLSNRARCGLGNGIRLASDALASELPSGPDFATNRFFAIAFNAEEQVS